MPVTPKELFEVRVPKGIVSKPERVKEVQLVLQFRVSGPEGGDWIVDTVSEPPSCQAGIREDAPCVIMISDEALMEIIASDPLAVSSVVMKHVVEGTLEVEGDVQQAMRLQKILSLAEADELR